MSIAMTAIPSIACLGVIGKNNNPLHMTLFPSAPLNTPILDPLQASLLLSSTLDIFEHRLGRSGSVHAAGTSSSAVSAPVQVSGDLGLLHAHDDRIAAYGFETNTGIKFVAIIDMRGRIIPSESLPPALAGPKNAAVMDGAMAGAPGLSVVGLREQDLKPVWKAMGSAYVRLLQNPFFEPDAVATGSRHRGRDGITSPAFTKEMKRLGERWVPGIASL